MSKRTYVPTLVYWLHRVCVYITRYRAQLRAFLTDDQEILLDAVLAACEAFTAAVPHPE